MKDEQVSIDQNPGRWLIAGAGGLLCEAGVQAMLTSQTASLVVTGSVAGIGGVLILVAVLWKKIGLESLSFFTRLNRIASHPGLWIVVIAGVWITTQILVALREVRINNEIIQTRNDQQAIAKVLDRLVMPRHLTKNQQKTISGFLSQFEPHEYSFRLPPNDEECGSYRADIEQALRNGGWTQGATNPYVYTGDVQEGLSITLFQTIEHAQKPSDWRNPSARVVLQQAFGLAGVRLYGGAGEASATNIIQDRLEISIGHPRKDSYVLTLPD